MQIEAFSKALLETGDLDPVYIAIHHSNLPPNTLHRLCVAYWCLYHLGAAAFLAEQRERNFWTALQSAAANEKKFWPRGTERRHWRGQQAIRSVDSLINLSKRDATSLVQIWSAPTFKQVAQRVQQARGFGPWISFKVADMFERVIGVDVDFSDCELGFYSEPRKGVALHLKGKADADVDKADIKNVVHHLIHTFRTHKAPPRNNRPVNVQEAETMLCKWKSHMGGHYEIGKDIREVSHALSNWGDLASELKRHMPKEVV